MSKKYDIDLGKGKIKISFTEKVITSFGGLSLLSAFLKKIEFRFRRKIGFQFTSNFLIIFSTFAAGFFLSEALFLSELYFTRRF